MDDSSNPSCCFCDRVIRPEEDPRGMSVRVGGLFSGKTEQFLYAHSTCFKDRLHPSFDLWWEYED